MKYLRGHPSDFFYDSSAEEEMFTEDNRSYEKVKQALVKKFGKKDRPEKSEEHWKQN